MTNHQRAHVNDRAAFERIIWLIFLRLAAVMGSLAVILVDQAGVGVLSWELFPTYLVLVLVCLANLAYMVTLRRVRRPQRFAAFQITLDVVFASTLIYLNGAGESNITFLYFACILAASIILGPAAGVTAASATTAILSALTIVSFLARHYDWTLPVVRVNYPGRLTDVYSGIAYLIAQAAAYYMVAALAGRLAHGLTGARLLNEKILESISDGVLAVDKNRTVQAMNRTAMRLLGLPLDAEVEGRSLDEVLDASRDADVLKAVFSGLKPSTSQAELRTTDGGRAPVAITAGALRDQRGEELGLVVMLIDLTERRCLEEALERAEKLEMVGQLAASIAHEIRNPLACIRGSAQELRDGLEADDSSRRLMDLMVRESDRINSIVTDFLQFSRVRQSALARCELTQTLRDVVAMLKRRNQKPETGNQRPETRDRKSRNSDEREGRIEIVFDPDEPVFCLGDVEQLKQVFLNLGLNALDAMSGGGTLRIEARVLEPATRFGREIRCGPRVCVSFSDTGEGMTSEVRSRMFDPFFTTKSRGTGLGLAIARRIIESHNGTIEVDSARGQGTTFRVMLEGLPAPQLQVVHG